MDDRDRKTRTVSTKLTLEELETVQALNNGRPITSEWLRGFLLERARRAELDEVVVGELLAVRTVVLTALARISPTTDVKAIVDGADKDKRTRAKAALTS